MPKKSEQQMNRFSLLWMHLPIVVLGVYMYYLAHMFYKILFTYEVMLIYAASQVRPYSTEVKSYQAH